MARLDRPPGSSMPSSSIWASTTRRPRPGVICNEALGSGGLLPLPELPFVVLVQQQPKVVEHLLDPLLELGVPDLRNELGVGDLLGGGLPLPQDAVEVAQQGVVARGGRRAGPRIGHVEELPPVDLQGVEDDQQVPDVEGDVPFEDLVEDRGRYAHLLLDRPNRATLRLGERLEHPCEPERLFGVSVGHAEDYTALFAKMLLSAQWRTRPPPRAATQSRPYEQRVTSGLTKHASLPRGAELPTRIAAETPRGSPPRTRGS